MKAQEFRNLSMEELQARLKALRVEYAAWREGIRLGKETNHARLRALRGDIARAQTILQEK